MKQLSWRVLPLVIWTLAVWVSRARNVLANSELTSWGLIGRLAVVGIFLLFGLAVLVQGIRRRDIQRLLGILAAWSIGYWLIRGGDILLDSQWSTGFKAVHTSLMFGTFALVALAIGKPNLR